MKDLCDYTHEVLYEKYRVRRYQNCGVQQNR
jgi:septin family protein